VTALAGGAASFYFEDITMPASTSSSVLYRIDECPDLMADGCIGDEHGNLVFLSVWARDTAGRCSDPVSSTAERLSTRN